MSWTTDPKVNGGSPIGPTFVVYERADGGKGYDREMALASVGKGWAGLINSLFDSITWNSKWNPNMGFNNVSINQVKEKFGTLRIYFSGGNPPEQDNKYATYVEGYIGALGHMSRYICETCGAPGVLRKASWVHTACDEHAKGEPFGPEDQD